MKIKRFIFGSILGTAALFAFPVLAAEGTAGDYMKQIGIKAGRGLVNILSSPAEIPCTIASDIKDKGAAGFFTGFGKGTVFMLRRILVGATEFGTLVIPMEATLPPVCSKAQARSIS